MSYSVLLGAPSTESTLVPDFLRHQEEQEPLSWISRRGNTCLPADADLTEVRPPDDQTRLRQANERSCY